MRLKAIALNRKRACSSPFQFHSGAVKGARIRLAGREYSSFNSTLVRLKAALASKRTFITSKFQFHSGAVKG